MKEFSLSNPGRIFYPESNITKLDLAKYYVEIKEWILPYVIDRPLTLVRCPSGYNEHCFYQKHLTDYEVHDLFPIKIKEKTKTEEYSYLKSIQGILSLVQLGVLEIHAWNCHVDEIEKPDVIIFDLDPAPNVPWKKVVDAAFLLRDYLATIKLQSFVKTTGGKGLHVVVPIKRKYDWDDIKEFSQNVVQEIVTQKPNEYIGTMSKAKRVGKIFIDYLRNGRGATSIIPYSTRARSFATVATPIAWKELTSRLKPGSFTLRTVPQRLKKLKNDPWEEYYQVKQTVKLSSFKK